MSGSAAAKHRQSGSGSRRLRPRTILGRAGLALTLVALGQAVLLPGTAAAATTLTVTTTADISASAGACGDNTITTPPSPLSLREATCLANNLGGAVTIVVSAGHYVLSNGELAPGKASGQTITITGAGAASTIIDGSNASRVFNIDSGSVGGVNASISGVTITGGHDTTYGGAGILDGSYTSTTSDSLTISNSVISNNTAVGTTQPGGGVQMYGGQLTITNSTIDNNTSNVEGSGVFYEGTGMASPEGLTVSGTTFANNNVATTVTSGVSGGALALLGTASTTYSVTNDHFTGNQASSNGAAAGVGAAIYEGSGNLTATGNTFTGNTVSGTGSKGGAVYAEAAATMHYNRITGNVGAGAVVSSATMDAGENWWGCNTGPNTTGCDTTSGTITNTTSFLKLVATTSPSHVVGPNGTATITASLTTDSLGAAIGGSNLAGAFDTVPVSFADPPGDATVAAGSVALSSGQASVGYNSHTTLGPDNDSVSLDNATVSAVIEVDEAPTITSANTTNFNVGTAGSFTVTTTGYPSAALTESGTLPTGLSFADQGNGTAKITGTASGPGGNYPITVTAGNGYPPNATQTLTISVGQPPAFTSPSTATFTIGTSGSFTVTTSGVPTVTAITESGGLPAGVSYADNGNGTATISGTPTGSGSSYAVTLTATNGVSPNATQSLTIQVNEAPAVTLNPSDQTVQPGTAVTFTAAASGVPTPSVQWQRSTDGGASFVNISGATSASYTFTTVAADDGNQYRAVFTNVVGSATSTAATLNVGTAPAFTSGNTATFVVGQSGTFTITTTGVPSATLSRTGAQFPIWLALNDNGDGTGSLTGTPPAGSGGTYTFTLKAANGFSPSANQTFTLEVDASPTITSADHTTFTRGGSNTFLVTTTAGYPASTTLSATGVPSGLTFHDNGDGTATLSGDPAAGTGGTHTLAITADNGGAATPATQSFTLTVEEAPTFTNADHATFSAGTLGTFAVTTSAAYPATTTVTKTAGALPSGVTFSPSGSGGTISGTPNAGSGGVYTITLTASNGVSPTATQTFTLTVNEPPTITSANHSTFTLGAAGNFTITTSPAQPAAVTITETGTLPPGITFTDKGDGTAILGGTPTAGGTYSVTVTASNGVLPDATQNLTVTVNSAPTITSADHATFAVGNAGTFTITTTPGTPATTMVTESGSLPSGVSFTDNGDGTATLSGTPAGGTGGSYSVTITASNGAQSASDQSFTLTVTELATIISANQTSLSAGVASSFLVTTTPGYPTAVTLTEAGTLPAGVSFTDNGDGTATLSGTPAAGSGGSYPLTLTTTNSAGHSDQAFTLTVQESPAFTSPASYTFRAGEADTFTITTAGGFPTPPVLTETGALPDGVTFTDNGNGSATLAGSATAGGVFPLTLTASNGSAPDVSQSFTLTVDGPPSITSPATMTFTAGLRGTFTVTTRPGVPAAPITLAESGALPHGVTFHDNGDGTAVIAGIARPSAIGQIHLTITASNGVNPAASQAFTLIVVRAHIVPLPPRSTPPPSNGALAGVPPIAGPGLLLHVTGSGFAAGAPIVIGIYSSPITLATVNADASGSFQADVRLPNLVGTHTLVASGLGSDGKPRFLETRLVLSAAPAATGSGSTTTSSGGGTVLANTGPDTDPRSTAGWALTAVLFGLGLMVITRRRRKRA